jgi:hypothetical protein
MTQMLATLTPGFPGIKPGNPERFILLFAVLGVEA